MRVREILLCEIDPKFNDDTQIYCGIDVNSKLVCECVFLLFASFGQWRISSVWGC